MDEKDDILRFFEVIWHPGDVREIRAFDKDGYVRYGYFDSAEKAAIAARQLASLNSVYTTLNPVNPALLARCANKIKKCGKKDAATSDKDIAELRLVLTDCDPDRPSGISSTDAEKAEAMKTAQEIVKELGNPLLAGDSGNGYHLIYKHDAETKEQIKAHLSSLAARHNGTVHVDKMVFNPARITKVLGTWAMKGDSTDDRPHRQSRILKIFPDPVTLHIPQIPQTPPPPITTIKKSITSTRSDGVIDFDARSWLAEHNVVIVEEKAGAGGTAILVLAGGCVFDQAHGEGEASIVLHPTGMASYQCFHNGCQGRTWADFREQIGFPKAQGTTPTCKRCSKEIEWLEKDGKWIPLNPETKTRHRCPRPQKEAVQVTTTETGLQKQSPSWIGHTKAGAPFVKAGIAAAAFYNLQDGNLIFCQEAFWAYSAGRWQIKADKAIKAEIQNFIRAVELEASLKHAVEDIFYQVQNEAFCKMDFDRDKWLINLKNGVYDLRERRLREHRRDDYQTIQLPFSYDPAATCPRWIAFMTEVIQDNVYASAEKTRDRLQEWSGYCLVPSTRLEKCLYLYGSGSNGKSVYLSILKALAGLENSTAMDPSELCERFQLAGLRGKLVNVCTDIKTKIVMSEVFKSIVSGEPQTTDVKHKEHITFSPVARHLFSANDFIATSDHSEGFFRRFDIVEFKRKFAVSERDESFKDAESNPLTAELPGIFNWALAGLFRLVANNWKMTASDDFDQAQAAFRMESNPVKMFLDEKCEDLWSKVEGRGIPAQEWETYVAQNSVTCDAFRRTYVLWCDDKGYKPLSDRKLGRAVAQEKIEKRRQRDGSERNYIYFGICLCS
jgi:P4 family phage/plasmid primase-like protien